MPMANCSAACTSAEGRSTGFRQSNGLATDLDGRTSIGQCKARQGGRRQGRGIRRGGPEADEGRPLVRTCSGAAIGARKLGKNASIGSSEFARRTCASVPGARKNELRTVSDQEGVVMAGAVTHSLVHQFASMKPTEFGATIEPKWQVADKLVKEVRTAVEKQQLTPLDGARVISSIAATLFGYDEFILREISPETLLAAPSRR